MKDVEQLPPGGVIKAALSPVGVGSAFHMLHWLAAFMPR